MCMSHWLCWPPYFLWHMVQNSYAMPSLAIPWNTAPVTWMSFLGTLYIHSCLKACLHIEKIQVTCGIFHSIWSHDWSSQLWNSSLKKIHAWTGFQAMTSAIPVQCSVYNCDDQSCLHIFFHRSNIWSFICWFAFDAMPLESVA